MFYLIPLIQPIFIIYQQVLLRRIRGITFYYNLTEGLDLKEYACHTLR
jgi:hypothetical protein